MYSTCLFCHGDLGRNEMVEHFPVGRRLAFDAGLGRLWVVCRRCERWNLTPLEERWEAIEECERFYRDTHLRVSTDNIGLCRLRDGTDLVRIGAPLRPELAAWRYGDQFGRRRRKHVRYLAAGGAVVGAYVVAGPILGLIGGGALFGAQMVVSAMGYRTVVRIRTADGILGVSQRGVARVVLLPSVEHGWSLEFPYGPTQRQFSGGVAVLRGADAARAARQLFPRINAAGGKPGAVQSAVELLERTPNLFHAFARSSSNYRSNFSGVSVTPYSLIHLPAAQRLALEMSLHEDDERRVLEGELAELQARWRDAEEIAAISDNLFVPEPVRAAVSDLREKPG